MKTAAIILNTPDEIGEITESDVICADNGLSRIHVTPVAVVGDLDSLENRKDGLKLRRLPEGKGRDRRATCPSLRKTSGLRRRYHLRRNRRRHRSDSRQHRAFEICKGHKIDARISGVGFDIKLLEGKVSDTAFEGQKISLFPFFGDALVTNSRGLYYPLENLLLSAGTNRGLSNVATANEISFTVESGILLMIKYY